MPARLLACALLLAAAGTAAAAGLPPAVARALAAAQVPPAAVGIVVRELKPGARDLVAVNAERPLNPASLTKLVTTAAALDRLGPAWTWSTPVWLTGTLRADGVLDGSLVIRGGGDPLLSAERLWSLLERVRQLGVREISGDIVLDDSAFAVEPGSAADFDGRPTRPYNVRASALLFNHQSVAHTFVPDPAAGVARVVSLPALAASASAPLPLSEGACGDWQAALQVDADAFRGTYPAACGEQSWWIADPDAAGYNARLVAALWQAGGGRLRGRVAAGAAPRATAPNFVLQSPPLALVVRDINKLSNNTMAQQLFYTLALAASPGAVADADAARAVLRDWLTGTLGPLEPGSVLDNGSGLSRATRLSARLYARLLQWAWQSPLMPEFAASLPILGVDGTLLRGGAGDAGRGRAHLKTGSLRDVAALAGYVDAASGRRLLLVAIVQHPNAAAARPALDALLRWALAL